VRIEAIADDDGRECRMVVIDVSGEARHAAVAALPPAGGSGSSRPA